MATVMSEHHYFDPDPDEMANGLEFCGEFDFEREFISEDQEFLPAPIPCRISLTSPNGSDGSTTTAAEQCAFADNANQNFPVLLHEIVSNEEFDCIHWLPCGTFFTISDKAAFTEQVIPRFFDARGTTKFTSFTRRLKRWMFSRVAAGANIGAYYHENFRRGEPELAANIIYPAKARNKNSPTTVLKSKAKASRRASTGCMVDPDKVDFGCTPIPVKPAVVMTATPNLPELDSEMAEFLASPEFVKDDGDDQLFADLVTSTIDMPATPPPSSSTLQSAPAPVSDCSLKADETFAPPQMMQLPPSYQPEKLQQSVQMQAHSLIQNASLNIMKMRPLAFPEGLNVRQRQVFQPQVRRHSCMPVFGKAVDTTFMLGASNGSMGVYTQPFPVASSSFNPVLQVNNMRINQNMMNMKSSGIPELNAEKIGVTNFGEFTSRAREQNDKWVDFDDYVARHDDEW